MNKLIILGGIALAFYLLTQKKASTSQAPTSVVAPASSTAADVIPGLSSYDNIYDINGRERRHPMVG